MTATQRAARTVTAAVVLVACVAALLEPHTIGNTHHAYGSWHLGALPVAHAQVQKEQDVRLQQLIVTAFTAEAQVCTTPQLAVWCRSHACRNVAQVASSSARFLQIMEDGINPAQLKSLVLSNTGMSSVVYGSAIAYAPGAYDFVVYVRAPQWSGCVAPNSHMLAWQEQHHNWSQVAIGNTHVHTPLGWQWPGTLLPICIPVRLLGRNVVAGPTPHAPHVPRSASGAEWSAGKPFQSMDLAVAYDYTSAGTEWYLAPRQEFASGDGTALKGHWSEPYFGTPRPHLAASGGVCSPPSTVVAQMRVRAMCPWRHTPLRSRRRRT